MVPCGTSKKPPNQGVSINKKGPIWDPSLFYTY